MRVTNRVRRAAVELLDTVCCEAEIVESGKTRAGAVERLAQSLVSRSTGAPLRLFAFRMPGDGGAVLIVSALSELDARRIVEADHGEAGRLATLVEPETQASAA